MHGNEGFVEGYMVQFIGGVRLDYLFNVSSSAPLAEKADKADQGGEKWFENYDAYLGIEVFEGWKRHCYFAVQYRFCSSSKKHEILSTTLYPVRYVFYLDCQAARES